MTVPRLCALAIFCVQFWRMWLDSPLCLVLGEFAVAYKLFLFGSFVFALLTLWLSRWVYRELLAFGRDYLRLRL